MKEKFLIAMLFLGLALASSGCSKDYMAEREFWKAEKILKQVPRGADPTALNAPAEAFQHVADKYPGTPKAIESLQVISNVRIRQKNYEAARAAMRQIIQSVGPAKDQAVNARYRIAQIYDAEGNWAEAEKNYWEIAEFHPLNPKGLYAPIYVLEHYKRAGDANGFQRIYVKTLDHYEGLAKQVGPIETLAGVKNYLAMAYLLNNDAKAAIGEWLSIQESFPKSAYAPLALLAAAETSSKSQNYGDALQYFQKFFDAYPKHPYAGRAVFPMGLIYYGMKDFVKTREVYQRGIDEYFSKSPEELAELKLLIAQSYQEEGKWPEADKIYSEIEMTFGNTGAALQVPLLRSTYFRGRGEVDKANQLLDEAIQKYDQMESSEPESRMVSAARRFKASARAQKGDWTAMITDVEKYMNEETNPVRKGRWLFLKGLLTKNRLNQPAEAKEIFKSFMAQYPDHPFVPRAQKQIEAIDNPQTQEPSPAQADKDEAEALDIPETPAV